MFVRPLFTVLVSKRFTPVRLSPSSCPCRVTPLDLQTPPNQPTFYSHSYLKTYHETGYQSMKYYIIILARFRKLHKIIHRLWRTVPMKFDIERSQIRRYRSVRFGFLAVLFFRRARQFFKHVCYSISHQLAAGRKKKKDETCILLHQTKLARSSFQASTTYSSAKPQLDLNYSWMHYLLIHQRKKNQSVSVIPKNITLYRETKSQLTSHLFNFALRNNAFLLSFYLFIFYFRRRRKRWCR